MIIFIKSCYKQKGVHRILESLEIHEKCKVIFVNTIQETNQYSDSKALFGGFVPHELAGNLTIEDKYYVFCSPFGQADLSGQDFYSPEISLLFELKEMIDKKYIKNVICASISVAERMNYIYLPPVKLIDEKNLFFNRDRKNYGFLGNNFRKHKNVVNQLAAMSMLKPKEKIIVSNASAYRAYGELFNCEFEDKNLMSDESYYKEISTHRLCFQCSFSEAFDYQAFEYAMMGVPIIGSHALYWLPSNLKVKNTDNYIDILYTAQMTLSDDKLYWRMSNKLKEVSLYINENNKIKLIETIDKIMEE